MDIQSNEEQLQTTRISYSASKPASEHVSSPYLRTSNLGAFQRSSYAPIARNPPPPADTRFDYSLQKPESLTKLSLPRSSASDLPILRFNQDQSSVGVYNKEISNGIYSYDAGPIINKRITEEEDASEYSTLFGDEEREDSDECFSSLAQIARDKIQDEHSIRFVPEQLREARDTLKDPEDFYHKMHSELDIQVNEETFISDETGNAFADRLPDLASSPTKQINEVCNTHSNNILDRGKWCPYTHKLIIGGLEPSDEVYLEAEQIHEMNSASDRRNFTREQAFATKHADQRMEVLFDEILSAEESIITSKQYKQHVNSKHEMILMNLKERVNQRLTKQDLLQRGIRKREQEAVAKAVNDLSDDYYASEGLSRREKNLAIPELPQLSPLPPSVNSASSFEREEIELIYILALRYQELLHADEE